MILALFNRDHFDYLSYYICLVEEGLFLACMCLLSISINIPFFIEINAVFLRVNFRKKGMLIEMRQETHTCKE